MLLLSSALSPTGGRYREAMGRSPRIQLAGGLHHVSTRGNLQAPIYLDDHDRVTFLAMLAKVVDSHRWQCHAYCLMTNHYHALFETSEANISAGMEWLNGGYARAFNRRHGRLGHLFERRFHSVLIEDESQLYAVHRYLALNPVRARQVVRAEAWPWSSYAAVLGTVPRPGFLAMRHIETLGSVRDYRSLIASGGADEAPSQGRAEPRPPAVAVPGTATAGDALA
jgi:putative transposase